MRPALAIVLPAALLLVGACAAPGPATTSAADPRTLLEALPPAITTVHTAGWWTEGGREGTFRIALIEQGFDQLVARLYVQWLELVDEETGLRVLTTAGLDQLNELPAYQLEIDAIRELPDALEIELKAFSPYLSEERRFLVRAGPPGVARLEERPRRGARPGSRTPQLNQPLRRCSQSLRMNGSRPATHPP